MYLVGRIRYTLQSTSGNGSWNLILNNLPSGYDWERDINGRVMAVVTANGIDNTSVNHMKELQVGIDYRPGPAYFNLSNICNSVRRVEYMESMVEESSSNQAWLLGNEVSIDIFSNWVDGNNYHSANINNLTSEWIDWKMGNQNPQVNGVNNLKQIPNPINCCNAVTLNFYSYSATSYFILYRKVNDLSFIVEQVPIGEFSKTISGLDEFSYYVFYVGAVNSIGETLSNPAYHSACKRDGIPDPVFAKITGSPNPADYFINLTLNDPVNKITQININKIDNVQIGKIVNSATPQKSLYISIRDLPSGYYNATIITKNNLIYTTKFLKN